MIESAYMDAAHADIDTIFRNILPQYGREPRDGQIKLCHDMFDALAHKRIALCDAGVGIGKTDAFIIAALMLHKHQPHDQRLLDYYGMGGGTLPFVIATSNIQLQRAILDEYIPFLSNVLLKSGMIQHPFCGEIQKGKQNYVCRERLMYRLKTANLEKKNPVQRDALLRLQDEGDLDRVSELSVYDRKRVCVPRQCRAGCASSAICPYRQHMENAMAHPALFQVCNHHYLLADMTHWEQDAAPIIPHYRGVVIDEAHQFYSAVQTICGKDVSCEKVESLLTDLRNMRMNTLANKLAASFDRLFQAFFHQAKEETLYKKTAECKAALKDTLSGLENAMNAMQGWQRTDRHQRKLLELREVLNRFYTNSERYFCYSEWDDAGSPCLRTVDRSYRNRLNVMFWHKPFGFVLTSGTLAAGGSMDYFKARMGLDTSDRLTESYTPSPFDYKNNALIYIPQRMPSCADKPRFQDEAAREIAELIRATNGHTLVLCTSFGETRELFERVKGMVTEFPLFAMYRRGRQYLEAFRKSKNGVLFMSGSWEGTDFPGDIVSSLIIPRLPFPRRDALHEGQRNEYREIVDFLGSIITPEMQIKIAQGAGRMHRLITDTGVISVLDGRAAPGAAYHKAVMAALPPCPVTRELSDVRQFILLKKNADYFFPEETGDE